MLQSLKGYRTYILVGIGAIVWGLGVLGYIPTGIETQILALLGIGSVGTVRAAIG